MTKYDYFKAVVAFLLERLLVLVGFLAGFYSFFTLALMTVEPITALMAWPYRWPILVSTLMLFAVFEASNWRTINNLRFSQRTTTLKIFLAKYLLGWSELRIRYCLNFEKSFDESLKFYLSQKADISKF